MESGVSCRVDLSCGKIRKSKREHNRQWQMIVSFLRSFLPHAGAQLHWESFDGVRVIWQVLGLGLPCSKFGEFSLNASLLADQIHTCDFQLGNSLSRTSFAASLSLLSKQSVQDQPDRHKTISVVRTCLNSCCVFNPAPYQAPVAVIAATLPVMTHRRTDRAMGVVILKS